MLHPTLNHYEVVSAVTACPPAMLFVSRSIVFKTSMEAWMHKSKPRGIYTKVKGIFVTIGKDFTKAGFVDTESSTYAKLQKWTRETMASFDEYILQFKQHQTQLVALPNLIASTPAMMDYAATDKVHSEKLVRWVDVQIAFLKKTIDDYDHCDGDARSGPTVGWIMAWTREALTDMRRIRRYIHEYRQEIKLFANSSS